MSIYIILYSREYIYGLIIIEKAGLFFCIKQPGYIWCGRKENDKERMA